MDLAMYVSRKSIGGCYFHGLLKVTELISVTELTAMWVKLKTPMTCYIPPWLYDAVAPLPLVLRRHATRPHKRR